VLVARVRFAERDSDVVVHGWLLDFGAAVAPRGRGAAANGGSAYDHVRPLAWRRPRAMQDMWWCWLGRQPRSAADRVALVALLALIGGPWCVTAG
jgi:hypothetical protein